MLERKNIDRVFQENLKDLEIYPNKRVWNKIEGSLNGKAARPPVALWKRLSGIAVMFAAVISAGLFFLNNDTPNPVINQPLSETETDNIEENKATPLTPVFVKPTTELAENTDKIKVNRKSGKPIFIKKPNNNVIVTDTEIASIYSTIENKYVVDKNVFLNDIDDSQSIAERMEEIPQNLNTVDVIDKKWLAYNTKNVSAVISSSKSAYNNINTNKSGVILTPVGKSSSGGSSNERNKASVSGDLNQSIEYFELPIEMKYNLYDKKIGLNVVGGFSTLILSNNSVSMITQNSVTDLGDANNLNDFNFSGNVGVDLDYKISKSWYLNVAPMFKYQFNTYSGNSGNFRPYYFGLYSGLNYKF